MAKDHGKHSCSDYIMIIGIVAGYDFLKKDRWLEKLNHSCFVAYFVEYTNSLLNSVSFGSDF